MRNLLALLAAFVLLFLALGAWRGWYAVSRQSADAGRVAFRIDVEPARIGNDVLDAMRSLVRAAKKEKAEPVEP